MTHLLELDYQDFKDIKGFLKTAGCLKSYSLDYADHDEEEAIINRTYQQIEILDGSFTIEFDVFIRFQFKHVYDDYIIVNKDLFFRTLYEGEDEVKHLSKEEKEIIINALYKSIEVTC